MATKTISPVLAQRAGNGARFDLKTAQDPAFLALQTWNKNVIFTGTPPTGTEKPTRDNRAYTVLGSSQKFCRPFVRVAWEKGWVEGPEVRFVEDDEGLWLSVALEEDFEHRVAGALPFDVSVKRLALLFAGQTLAFDDVLQQPLPDPATGPAFRLEARAKVPEQSRALLVDALQNANRAQWMCELVFVWRFRQNSPQPAEPAPTPIVLQPMPMVLDTSNLRVLRVLERTETDRPAAEADVINPAVFANIQLLPNKPMLNPAILKAMIKLKQKPRRPPVQTEEILIQRKFAAHYPEGFAENDPIYAAVTGAYFGFGWRSSAQGWFQPTPIQDTVYCLPDAYRLEIDSQTGLPAFLPVLTRIDSGVDDGQIGTEDLRVRLSIRVAPDFDAARLGRLRSFVRGASNGHAVWADLVLGGYTGARFRADDSLAGLGGLLSGQATMELDNIDAQGGFSLNFEGTTEFFALVIDRLTGAGLRGTVELDLKDEDGAARVHVLPVDIRLARTTPPPLEWTIEVPAPDKAGEEAPVLVTHNPGAHALRLGRIGVASILRSPATGQARDFKSGRADPIGGAGDVLEPGATQRRRLVVEDGFVGNGWDIQFPEVAIEGLDEDAVLRGLIDVSTASVEGWRVTVDCPPLEFFDQLTDADREPFRDVIAVEVEVRRVGSQAVQDLRLTKQVPSGGVVLSRSLMDFVDADALSSAFEYRRRLIRIMRADDWSDWAEERGRAVSVFFI